MAPHGDHAVVIGASMGGLVAAAALAPHYARVTVIERDELPGRPAHRRGVPQGRHAHGLQPGGLLALEKLLPGLTAELVAGGARTGDLASLSHWFVGGGVLSRADSQAPAVALTRPFLEHHVRSRVAALDGVTVRDCTQVHSLVADRSAPGGARVTGVTVLPAAGGPLEQLAADLVVDASGRGSRLPAWLHELGYRAAVEEQVHCRMAYLSRRWRLTNDVMGEDLVTVIAPAATPRFGVLIVQEDGSSIVTLGGLLDGAPARDDEAYRAFARSLPDSRIADALQDAEPLTELQPSHFPYSRRRRYDRLRSFPAGLLAVGDSIASFNPMYGQGMTVAALEAVALRELLDGGALDARKFFRRAHRIEDVAWKISTASDLRFDEVEGRRSADLRFMNRYLDRFLAAARTDPTLARQFLRVASFLDRPESLFKPSIVRRVIAGRGAGRAGAAPPDADAPVAAFADAPVAAAAAPVTPAG